MKSGKLGRTIKIKNLPFNIAIICLCSFLCLKVPNFVECLPLLDPRKAKRRCVVKTSREDDQSQVIS